MSYDHTPLGPNRKTLRRKPPPPLTTSVGSSEAPGASNTFPNGNSYLMPIIPPRPNTNFNLKVNTNSYYDSPMNPEISSPGSEYSPYKLSDESNGSGIDDSGEFYNEETILSMENPKPMGPKELPEYEFYQPPQTLSPPALPARQPTSQSYKTRQFQQLSRPKSLPLQSETSPSNPPYPTYDLPELEDHDFALPDQQPLSKTSQIINHSMSTPSRIPKLHTDTSLAHHPLIQQKSMPSIMLAHPSQDSSALYSPITPTGPHDMFRGVDSVHDRMPPSPISSHSLSIPSIHTPKKNNMESSFPERPYTGSASSSPSKSRRSPPYRYSQTEFGDDDDYCYDFEGNTHWNIENNRHSNGLDHNYNFLDDEYLETPINGYFDYSILPELPSATVSSLESPIYKKASSTSPLLSNTTFRDSVYATSPILPTLPAKKKDELPPVPLDLPQLPFSSASLVTQHFSACKEIWSLRSIFQWCLKLRIWLHDSFISKREFKKALIKLLVFHRRELPLDLIGQNVDQILDSLTRSNAISYCPALPPKDSVEDTGIKHSDPSSDGVYMNDSVYISGVLTELTPCYYNGNNHGSSDISLRCYSSQCYLNKIIDHETQLKNMNINKVVLGEDWASHWKLSAVDLKNIDKTISKRQSLIFDLLRYEQTFIQRASCFIEEVAPEFIKASRMFLGNDIVSVNKFEEDIINPGHSMIKVHQQALFEPLLRILIANGKFIKNVEGIAELYTAWAQEIKNPLLRYMSTVPMIEDLLNNENLKRWVDVNVRNMNRVKELKVNGPLLFMSTFNSRYQSLPLQLYDVRKLYDPQEPEYIALTKAIDAIKRVGVKVNDMKRHSDNIHALKKAHQQLVWKNNIIQPPTNLGSENRKFYFRGDVTRKGDLKINSYTNHLILLDHYLFITEKVKNPKSGSYSLNRVIENPIPVEFLLVEEKEASTGGFDKITLSSSPNTLASPSLSGPSNDTNDEDEPSSFPFKIRYAGRGKHDSYTFSTKTERERADWIKHISDARSNLCKRLKKTDPYVIEPIASTCFAYEFANRVQKLQLCAENDPIYDASSDALAKLQALGYTNDLYNFSNARDHLVYSKVQSICVFEFHRTKYRLIGLSSGLFCSDAKNRWKKVVHGTDITKIVVETSLNLLIILGNKQLRYYPLDSILGVYYEKKRQITGVALSNDPVAFFSVGKHREITMLFYAKKKTNSGSTNFKVMIPETDNDGVFSAFKVVKRFYVQAECYGISIFNTSFAVHTNKGFEILELDKLVPRSIPEIPQTESSKRVDGYSRKSVGSSNSGVDAIRKLITASVKPMGMYKLANNTEFLCVYNDCAIFTNKHGKLSRTSFLKFDFKAKSVSFVNNHLFIVCEEVIEAWSISDFVNGTNKLIQVICGKDISAINSDTLCYTIANPLVQGLQLVFQLHPRAESTHLPLPPPTY